MPEKTCCRCKVSKTLDHYYKMSKISYCKPCWSAITVANQRRVKMLMIDYKGGRCSRCGYNKHFAALEFHHIDPSKKDFALSKISSLSEKVKLELDKCELLCSNCHREVHSNFVL